MTTELMQRNAQLSTLSNLAYKENPPDSTNGWTRMTIAPNTASGFSAVAYRNSNGEVAIAFRGTDSLKDMVTNGAFVSNGWRQQFSDAADFVNKVKLEMRDQGISGAPIVTGHSLGGGIAQVMGKMFGLNGAAFDAPGAAGVTQSAGFAQTAAQYGQSTGNQIGGDFTNYNSQGSLISAAGSQIGHSQSLVSLTDPSLAPLLIGGLSMLGGPFLAMLGFSAVGNIVSAHPSGGIERAMWAAATLSKALDVGTIQMSMMSWTQATGHAWLSEGSPPQVPVFKDAVGNLLAVVAKDGDNLTISTPDQSTIVRMRTSADTPIVECTVEKNGAPAMSCSLFQGNAGTVELKINALSEGGSVIGTIFVDTDGNEGATRVSGDVESLIEFVGDVNGESNMPRAELDEILLSLNDFAPIEPDRSYDYSYENYFDSSDYGFTGKNYGSQAGWVVGNYLQLNSLQENYVSPYADRNIFDTSRFFNLSSFESAADQYMANLVTEGASSEVSTYADTTLDLMERQLTNLVSALASFGGSSSGSSQAPMPPPPPPVASAPPPYNPNPHHNPYYNEP
jgi:hypothetical protein